MTNSATTGVAADAVELLTADHRMVEQLFHQLELATATDAVENQRDLAQRIVRELSVHASVEEQILYPALREVLEDGDRIAGHSLEEHATVKRLLAGLDGMEPRDEGFAAAFVELRDTVREHVTEEESRLFPQLADALGPEQLLDLGTALTKARAMAPTRPHPHAAARPAANLVAGAIAAMAGRVRDTVANAPVPGRI